MLLYYGDREELVVNGWIMSEVFARGHFVVLVYCCESGGGWLELVEICE
jgi:hypothetical protein